MEGWRIEGGAGEGGQMDGGGGELKGKGNGRYGRDYSQSSSLVYEVPAHHFPPTISPSMAIMRPQNGQ